MNKVQPKYFNVGDEVFNVRGEKGKVALSEENGIRVKWKVNETAYHADGCSCTGDQKVFQTNPKLLQRKGFYTDLKVGDMVFVKLPDNNWALGAFSHFNKEEEICVFRNQHVRSGETYAAKEFYPFDGTLNFLSL